VAGKFRVLLVYPNIPMMLVTPLSIAVFTWILKKEGFEVDLFETTQYWGGDISSPKNRVKYLQARDLFAKENLELLAPESMTADFRKKLESYKPDLLLYSFTEDALKRALQLLRVSNLHNIPTVVGGILAIAAPEWLISHSEINMICIGEGEEVVKDVAYGLSNGQDISAVPSLWIKRPAGDIIKNTMRSYVNLNDYSTDFSLFDESRFLRPMGGKIHRALPIETYRGCSNHCAYCNSPMHNRIARKLKRNYLRRKPVEYIRREIRNLVDNFDVNLLYFIDDCFLSRPRLEIEAFIDMYQEFRIPFWFNTRPERCTVDILRRLKDVGLFRVSFGVESGNEKFRKEKLGRNVSNDKLLRCFDIICQSGIQYSINCIIGFPFETRELVFDTIRLVKQIKGYDSITTSIFTPYRGTVLRQEAIEAGWLDPKALTDHTTSSSMLRMPLFMPEKIDGLMRTFPLYIEFDESAWQEIEKAEQFDPGGDRIFERYSEMYRERRWGGVPRQERL